MSIDYVAQSLGIIASGIIIYAFTHKSDERLKFVLIIANIFFAAHFFMLEAYAGMFVTLLNCARVAFSIKFHKSNNMMLFFMGVYLLTGYLVFENIFDLMPILSSLVGTYSMFKLSGIKLRLLGMLGSGSWLIYAIVFHSIGGMITEVAIITINLHTIFRLNRDRKEKTA